MKYDFRKLVVFSKDRIGKDARYMMSNKKAENELGWKSKITLENGLSKTYKSYLRKY